MVYKRIEMRKDKKLNNKKKLSHTLMEPISSSFLLYYS